MCEWIGEWLADGEINWYVNDWWRWVAGWSERPINVCASRRADGWVNVVGWAGAGGGQAWVGRWWLKGRSKRRGWAGALKALSAGTGNLFLRQVMILQWVWENWKLSITWCPPCPWWFNLQRTWSSPSSYLCSIPCGEQRVLKARD